MKVSENQHRIFTYVMYGLAIAGVAFYGYRGVKSLYQKYTTPTAQADFYPGIYTASPYSQRVYGMADPLVRSDFSAKDSNVNVRVIGGPTGVGGWQVDYGRNTVKVNNDQSGYYGQAPVYYPSYPSRYPSTSNPVYNYPYSTSTSYYPTGPVPPDYFNCFTNEALYYRDYCTEKYGGRQQQYAQPVMASPSYYQTSSEPQQYYYDPSNSYQQVQYQQPQYAQPSGGGWGWWR
jgi:hypothetical protein